MKPIRLPEPPASPRAMGGVPDIFEGGVHGVIRRAVVIGNGFPASENQSIGLVQALGLADKHTLYCGATVVVVENLLNMYNCLVAYVQIFAPC
ncbi:hypothetical protein FXO37_08067 [Capsicum annuum]|nr:hypothetical protein FXO37_08067 [Capsicum annuum]